MENIEKHRKLYPMKFVPIVDEAAGEICRLADLGFKDSEVENGWLSGSTISEVLETYLEELVGEDVYSRFGRQFPLMVRWLDLKSRTPLMVCPDDEVARQRYDTLGRKKFWYVAGATSGSKLYIGFREDITAAELYERSLDGTLPDMLNEMTPHAGDVYVICPGIVHAASKGLKILEISECSDLDFKICGWGCRPSPDRVAFGAEPKSRQDVSGADVEELSLEAAFDFIDLGKYDRRGLLRWKKDGEPVERIAESNEFVITGMNLRDALHINTGSTDSFLVYVCVKGAASVQMPDGGSIGRVSLKTGDSVLIPASVTDFFLVPDERDTLLIEASVEPCSDEDPYIDPDAVETLPDEDGQDGKQTLEEFLRRNRPES